MSVGIPEQQGVIMREQVFEGFLVIWRATALMRNVKVEYFQFQIAKLHLDALRLEDLVAVLWDYSKFDAFMDDESQTSTRFVVGAILSDEVVARPKVRRLAFARQFCFLDGGDRYLVLLKVSCSFFFPLMPLQLNCSSRKQACCWVGCGGGGWFVHFVQDQL